MANAAAMSSSLNGEVYDWAADAKALQAAVTRFRTRSDTELILHAYEHWGIEFLARLRGMFASRSATCGKRVLYLARDRLGLKPVVYARPRRRVRVRLGRCARCCRGCPRKPARSRRRHRRLSRAPHVPRTRTIFASASRLRPRIGSATT